MSRLVEMLPSLLVNKEALEFKNSELRAYIGGLNKHRFKDVTYLEGIKAHLEDHKLLYWNRLDVTIQVQGIRRVNTEFGPDFYQRVLEFYHLISPDNQKLDAITVVAGTNMRPWVMRSGDHVGCHRRKKVARMIALIRRFIDPEFDPEGHSLPPPMLRKRRYGDIELVTRLDSAANISSPPSKRVQCWSEPNESMRKI